MLTPTQPIMTHILVIDDDVRICKMLRHSLELSGYQVTEAYDGKKALAAHKADPADLLIMDMIMPGMEGIETITEFKRRSPATKIIAMSGGGMGMGTDYLNMAKKFGAYHTLTKPFSVERLNSVVAEVLENSRVGDARPAAGPTEA